MKWQAIPIFKLSFVYLLFQASLGFAASAPISLEYGRVQLALPELKSNVDLNLAAKVNGTWVTLDQSQGCLGTADGILCPLAEQALVRVMREGDRVSLRLEALEPLVFEGIRLEGILTLPGTKGWLSQGFQSWSQTGVLRPRKAPNAQEFERAMSATGEAEVYRRGSEFSWWSSFIGHDALSFFAGATSSRHLKSYIQFNEIRPDVYQVYLVSGAGERKALAAGAAIGEDWFLSLGTDLQDHFNRYADQLSSRRKKQAQPPLLGWNSWYTLWDEVREQDVLRAAELVPSYWEQRLGKDARLLTITIDDGWQKLWGDWETNSKFPRGLEGLALDLNARSLRMGLWIAPFLLDPKSQVLRDHPDWVMPDASYTNPAGKVFRVLDVTQKSVAEHLQSTIRRLIAAGVQQLKIDFLFAGTLEGTRSLPVTGMEAYREGLRLIREAAGPDFPIFAVGAPPLSTFDYVDGWRVGGDIAFKPAFLGIPGIGAPFISNQARSLAGRQAYCQVTLCDADPALLRGQTPELIDAGVWVAAAAGGALVLSDQLEKIDSKRLSMTYNAVQIKNGLSGQPARLQSYFPSSIPQTLNSMKDGFFSAIADVPEVWIMPDGTRVALNLEGKKKLIENKSVAPRSSLVLPSIENEDCTEGELPCSSEKSFSWEP